MIWSAVDIQGQDKSDNPQIEFYQDRLCIPSSLFIGGYLLTCFVIFCFKNFQWNEWWSVSWGHRSLYLFIYLYHLGIALVQIVGTQQNA